MKKVLYRFKTLFIASIAKLQSFHHRIRSFTTRNAAVFLLIVGILGPIIAGIGWYLDKITMFPTLLKQVCPSYYYAKHALEFLDSHGNAAIMPNNPAFVTLLRLWGPSIPDRIRHRIIGIYRFPTGITEFGSRVRIYYPLRLMISGEPVTAERHYPGMDLDWPNTDAEASIKRDLDTSLCKTGQTLMLLGILLSILSATGSFYVSRIHQNLIQDE